MQTPKVTTMTSAKRFAERYPQIVTAVNDLLSRSDLDPADFVFRSAARVDERGELWGSWISRAGAEMLATDQAAGVIRPHRYTWVGFEASLGPDGQCVVTTLELREE